MFHVRKIKVLSDVARISIRLFRISPACGSPGALARTDATSNST
jgi:hypothetical protein